MASPKRWRPGAGPRLLVMGASLVQGVSVERRYNVGRSLASLLDASALLDLSTIGMLTSEMVEQLPQALEFAPDVAVLELGGADCLVHPPRIVQDFVDAHFPPRWAGDEGLQPRAVYDDESAAVRARQRAECLAKSVFKYAAVRVGGGRTRATLAEVEEHSLTVVRALRGAGVSVYLLRRTRTSGFSSPGTNASMAALDAVIGRVASQCGAAVVDPNTVLDYWSDFLADRVHLSASGHARVAELISSTMRNRAGVTASGAVQ